MKLDIAVELSNSDRHMTPKERVFDILSKGGKVLRKNCNPIAQATWGAYERGYLQAVEDIKSGILETLQKT